MRPVLGACPLLLTLHLGASRTVSDPVFLQESISVCSTRCSSLCLPDLSALIEAVLFSFHFVLFLDLVVWLV